MEHAHTDNHSALSAKSKRSQPLSFADKETPGTGTGSLSWRVLSRGPDTKVLASGLYATDPINEEALPAEHSPPQPDGS